MKVFILEKDTKRHSFAGAGLHTYIYIYMYNTCLCMSSADFFALSITILMSSGNFDLVG